MKKKYSSRYIQDFEVNVPVDNIDLYKWITGMTDADYASYSPAHKAMGSFTNEGVFYMTNVENIGTETIVQNYQLVTHAANRVQLYSARSTAYIMRWFPVKVGVPWQLYVQPVSATSSRLICLIGVDYPNPVLRIAAWFGGLGGFFLRKHLNREGRAFALDIEQKFTS
ncbi:hypothetical protein [Flavihumibacter solisilvae]|uniref:SRPBCC family protein n=1 Tax=Flavihumibacter solisilvae TaxID=1349421 RepID=A0A0C1LJ54_9BACT|nr:hypothetical protein [Flavihumibacter solisilvae]KIC95428.1 hypothetical protein OI18_05920 [Flavihumibacter solisilvae]